jgi:hypothetical protein
MKAFWDERYREAEYVYGKEPNTFFATQIQSLAPGNLLLPCEGEGRNAVFAALQHWQVVAFDQSVEGQKKCLQLAKDMHCALQYDIADATQFDYGSEKYDAIGLIYAHFPPSIRKQIHHSCLKALKPGGVIILEAFTPQQLNYSSGGPKQLDMLYTSEGIRHDFEGASQIEVEALETELSEGPYHKGTAAIVRAIIQK